MDDAALAAEVAGTGAAIVRSRFRRAVEWIAKGATDFATDVDIVAERAMLDLLHRHRPGDAVMARSSAAAGRRTPSGAGSSTRCAAPSTSPLVPARWA